MSSIHSVLPRREIQKSVRISLSRSRHRLISVIRNYGIAARSTTLESIKKRRYS